MLVVPASRQAMQAAGVLGRQRRRTRGIPETCPSKALGSGVAQRGDGRYSTPAVAALLNVNRSTVAVWCRRGRLDAVRDSPQGSYRVQLTEETIQALKHATPRRVHRRPLPLNEATG
jgi:hypothetical protein